MTKVKILIRINVQQRVGCSQQNSYLPANCTFLHTFEMIALPLRSPHWCRNWKRSYTNHGHAFRNKINGTQGGDPRQTP